MEEKAKRKRHWSTGEKATALALVLFLGIFVTFFGVEIYASSSGSRFCGSFWSDALPRKRRPQHHLLNSEFPDEHNYPDQQHWISSDFSHILRCPERKWSDLLKQQLVRTHYYA